MIVKRAQDAVWELARLGCCTFSGNRARCGNWRVWNKFMKERMVVSTNLSGNSGNKTRCGNWRVWDAVP